MASTDAAEPTKVVTPGGEAAHRVLSSEQLLGELADESAREKLSDEHAANLVRLLGAADGAQLSTLLQLLGDLCRQSTFARPARHCQ